MSSTSSSSASAKVRVLVRDPSKADFPADVEVAQGDMLDIDSLRSAFSGVRTLFLLNAVTADEFTQATHHAQCCPRSRASSAWSTCRSSHAERSVNVPHFAVKSGAERMIEQMGFNATILRPAYFIDNDLTIKDVILNHGVYPMPIGSKGVAMVDTRDIAEVAAIELIRRDQAPGKLPVDVINLVGPDTLTGPRPRVHLVGTCFGRPVAYGGDDPSRVRAEPDELPAEVDGV